MFDTGLFFTTGAEAAKLSSSGDNIVRSSPFTGVVDTAHFSFSGWLKTSGNSFTFFLMQDSSNNNLINLGISQGSGLSLQMISTSGSSLLAATGYDTIIDDGLWHHIAVYLPFTNGDNIVYYLDGSPSSINRVTDNRGGSGTFSYTSADEIYIASLEDADVADFYVSDEAIDFTSASVLATFLDNDRPVPRPNDGSDTVTGVDPVVWMTGGSTFAVNKGDGGAFPDNTTIVDSVNLPIIVGT